MAETVRTWTVSAIWTSRHGMFCEPVYLFGLANEDTTRSAVHVTCEAACVHEYGAKRNTNVRFTVQMEMGF